MKGHYYRRNCTCKKKRCTCGSTYTFVIDVGIDPKTGKRKQKSQGGFKTKQEAEAASIALLHELQNGTYFEESNISFEELATEWLDYYSATRNVKPGTIRIRQHELDKLLPYFAKLKIKDITQRRYQTALNDLKEKGYADNTLDGIHRTGRMIFKYAIQMEIIKKDPTEYAYVKKDKKTIEELEEQGIPKYMEKEELLLLLDTAEKRGLEMDYLIFITLAYTGMRVGELVSLKWKDIDFTNHTINITKTYYNPKNNTVEYMLVTAKTMSSVRTINVEEEVISALLKHKEDQDKIKQRLKDSYYDKDFIFAKTKRQPGYPIFIKTVEDRMRRLLQIAGLATELTPHSLRHTHTSLLAEAKATLDEIMDRLGHSDDDTTRNVYLHMTKELKKEASHKFGQLMRSLD